MGDLIADMQNKVSELIADAKEPLLASITELEAENVKLEGHIHSSADWLRAQTAEAALAERDDFIDFLYSESGIPTRHWRDTITQCVADLRTRVTDLKKI